MPGKEFVQTVGGGQGEAVQTSQKGSVQTNNYRDGSAFDFAGGAYPYTVNPSFTGQILHITAAGDIIARVTTVNGDTFDIPLAGGTGVIDWISFDSVEFRDPNGTTARIAGSVGGE